MNPIRRLLDEGISEALWEQGIEKAIELAKAHGVSLAYLAACIMYEGNLLLVAGMKAMRAGKCGPDELAWSLDELDSLGITPNLRLLDK